MVVNRKKLFYEILNNFLDKFVYVEAIVISDVDGLIIAGEKRKDIKSSLEIVSVLTTLINPVLVRIRNEFAFKSEVTEVLTREFSDYYNDEKEKENDNLN